MATDIGGVWRTVGGRRIFIKDGEDLETAMKKSGKFGKKEEKTIKEKIEDIRNMDIGEPIPKKQFEKIKKEVELKPKKKKSSKK